MALRITVERVSSGTKAGSPLPPLKNATLGNPLPIDMVVEESNTVENGIAYVTLLAFLSLAAQGKLGTTITAFSATATAVLLNGNNEFNP